jgi:hypothetical protein
MRTHFSLIWSRFHFDRLLLSRLSGEMTFDILVIVKKHPLTPTPTNMHLHRQKRHWKVLLLLAIREVPLESAH